MSTKIANRNTSTVDQALAFVLSKNPKRPLQVSIYIREVYRLCTKIRLDPTFVIAQAIYETRMGNIPFSSFLWIEHLNPAGIGQTDAGPQNLLSTNDPIIAARAHVVHVEGYVRGHTKWVTESGYDKLDPRWNALKTSGMMGKAKNVEDFGGGIWASQAKDKYATSILGFMKNIMEVK